MKTIRFSLNDLNMTIEPSSVEGYYVRTGTALLACKIDLRAALDFALAYAIGESREDEEWWADLFDQADAERQGRATMSGADQADPASGGNHGMLDNDEQSAEDYYDECRAMARMQGA